MYAVLRTAWLCDDSYITFRTVDNFIHGYGLRWNVDERVQSYTHPLWMLLISGFYWLTRDVHYTVPLVSLGLSLAAVLVYCFGVARTIQQAIVGVLILVFSKAFVDYSTSGLENPLTYLLLAGFLAVYLGDCRITRRRLFSLSLLASLAVVNRMDTLLLFAPALLEAMWRSRKTGTRQKTRSDKNELTDKDSGCSPATSHWPLATVVLGFAPFIAWEIFAVIYYGFPFPNTAYAKLDTGIPAMDLVYKGLGYLWNSIQTDPLTLTTIAGALLLTVLWRDRRRIALAVGIALYLLYVVRIGGDFMSGRFLTAPLLAAVILLGSLPLRMSPIRWLSAGLLVVCLGLCASYPSLFTGSGYGLSWNWNFDENPVADERAYYYSVTGLFADPMGIRKPSQEVIDTARERRNQDVPVTGMGTIGFYGYYIGPRVHVIDIFALSDPLLARLPMRETPDWRVGHFIRHVPEGYIERLEYLKKKEAARGEPNQAGVSSGPVEDHFADPNLELFYNDLCVITRGPLFTWQRWKTIWNMNLGRYNDLINRDFYRHPPLRVWMAEVYGGPKPRGIARNLARDRDGNIPLPPAGLIVILPRTIHVRQLLISLDGNDNYQINYPQRGHRPVEQSIPAESNRPGQVVRIIEVPPDVAANGYSRFRIFPVRGDGRYSMRFVRPVIDRPTR